MVSRRNRSVRKKRLANETAKSKTGYQQAQQRVENGEKIEVGEAESRKSM